MRELGPQEAATSSQRINLDLDLAQNDTDITVKSDMECAELQLK